MPPRPGGRWRTRSRDDRAGRAPRLKAVRVHSPGGIDAMRVDDVPDPDASPGQVVVELESIGVNFIDIYFRSGLYRADTPFTLGLEGAGTVMVVGPDVLGVAPGDRVVYTGIRGAYAERHAVPADRVVRIPDGLSTRDAAAAMLQGMTAHYLTVSTHPLNANDVCLIHAAAGGVGLLFCQIAKRRGATVIGTVSTDEKAALARAAGADHTIRYTDQDFEAEVKRLTGGEGVSVVYDSVGAATFNKSLNCLRRRGMMVLFGQSSGPVPPFDLNVLNAKGSLFVTRPSLFAYIASRDELLGRANEVLGWVRDGSLELRIEHEFPLSHAGEAHRALEGRKTTGKVLLIP